MGAADTPVRVLVAEDHPLMRDAIVRSLALDEHLAVVATAARGEQALSLICEQRPDVAVLDLELGDMSALEVLKRLPGHSPTRILVLSAHTDRGLVHAALAEGVHGYLSKATEPEGLGSAVRRIAAGELVLEPRLHNAVFAEIRDRGPAAPELSERELQVLRLAAAGENERAIADLIHASQSTVKTYFRRIYDKLGVRDKASAVAAALRLGLIE